MKSLFKKKKKPMSAETSLQITSMADIFTIILVFLLKTVSMSAASMSPALEMSLPDGRSKDIIKETLKIDIGRDGVALDGNPLLKLANYRFDPTEVPDAGGEPAELTKAFLTERANQPLSNDVTALLVLADQHVPYVTLKSVMASAADAGFISLQLVVVENTE